MIVFAKIMKFQSLNNEIKDSTLKVHCLYLIKGSQKIEYVEICR